MHVLDACEIEELVIVADVAADAAIDVHADAAGSASEAALVALNATERRHHVTQTATTTLVGHFGQVSRSILSEALVINGMVGCREQHVFPEDDDHDCKPSTEAIEHVAGGVSAA